MKEYNEYKISIERKALNETDPGSICSDFQEKAIKDLDLGYIIEGLLFVVGDEGISVDQIEIVLDQNERVVLQLLDQLVLKYQQSVYPFEIVSYGGRYKFLSKMNMHSYVEHLFQNTKATVLSQSALETLAIIAYKQPITRVEIEEIRGVGSDMMLRKLQARDLIREKGRSDAPGRPILYEVTKEFMDSFKLLSMDELPDLPIYQSDSEEDLFD